MSDDLHVVSARLHALASAQQRAAHQLATATELPKSTAPAVAVTHGLAASATAGALAAVQTVRAEAGLRMAAVSGDMGHRLRDAAARYDHTDQASAAVFEQSMPGAR